MKKEMEELREKLNCWLDLTSEFHRNLLWEHEEEMMDTLIVSIKCYGHEEVEEGTEIARMSIELLPSESGYEFLEESIDTYDIADAIDSELEDVCSFLFYNDDEKFDELIIDITSASYITYLERLWVDERFRGNGLGTFLVKNIFQLIKKASRFAAPAVMFIPGPYEHAGEDCWEDEKEKLVKFYENFDAIRLSETVYCIKETEE